jgi:hypothetical protein
MPPAGFEPVIPACERPQTYALDSAATAIGTKICIFIATSTDSALIINFNLRLKKLTFLFTYIINNFTYYNYFPITRFLFALSKMDN